jgi:hypothetical protein
MTYEDWNREVVARRKAGSSVTAIAQWNHQFGLRTHGTQQIREVLRAHGGFGEPASSRRPECCLQCDSAPLLENLCPDHLRDHIDDLQRIAADGGDGAGEALELLASIAKRLAKLLST